MSEQWLVFLLCNAFVCAIVSVWFFEDRKKRKVKDANREAALAAIGMLVADHNSDRGVNGTVFSATFMLLGIHVSPQAASIFSNTIEATDDCFYFPEFTFRRFCNVRLDSGFTIKELLYRGDFALKNEHCQDSTFAKGF